MKINSNTFALNKESSDYKKLEAVLQKVAAKLKIDNVKTATLNVNQNECTVMFKKASPSISQLYLCVKGIVGLQECIKDDFYTDEKAIMDKLTTEGYNVNDVYFPTLGDIPEELDVNTIDQNTDIIFKTVLVAMWVPGRTGGLYIDRAPVYEYKGNIYVADDVQQGTY